MGRNANYRLGDRAEELGIVLMQMFCAIAPVPRQEDFGIFDAVATLLRKEKKVVYAKDSFLVQFKARTIEKVKYKGEKFKAVLNQELGLFIAQVDLKEAAIKLYSVGAALADPNIYNASNLVFHLRPIKGKPFDGDTLHVAPDPVLHWRVKDIARSDKAELAYKVMTQWLELDRRNRRYRKIGRQAQVLWQTNEVPFLGSIISTMHPSRENLALADVVPAVEFLGGLAGNEAELAMPMIQVISWLRSRNVDSTSLWFIELQLEKSIIGNLIRSELAHNDNADFAVYIKFDVNASENYIFWEYSGGTQHCAGSKHQCSNLDEIRDLGFEANIDSATQKIIEIHLGESWLAHNKCELLEIRNNVFLLKAVAPVDTTTSPFA